MEEVEAEIPSDVLRLSATEVRSNWSATLEQVAVEQRRIIVERHGMPQAVMISPAVFRRLLTMERQEPQAAVVQVVSRVQEIATEILHRQVDELITTVVRRVLEEYTAPDTPNPPIT